MYSEHLNNAITEELLMSGKELSQSIKNSQDEVLRQRTCRNIAAGLCHQYRIQPDGINLIALTGNGAEQTNEEALTNWVKRNLETDSILNAIVREELDRLCDILALELYDFR